MMMDNPSQKTAEMIHLYRLSVLVGFTFGGEEIWVGPFVYMIPRSLIFWQTCIIY